MSYITKTEAARRLGRQLQTIRNMIDRGELTPHRIEGRKSVMIDESELRNHSPRSEEEARRLERRRKRELFEATSSERFEDDPTPEEIRQRCAQVHRMRAIRDRRANAERLAEATRVAFLLRRCGSLSIKEIRHQTGMSFDVVKRALETLVASSRAERIGRSTKSAYRLVDAETTITDQEPTDSILARFRKRAESAQNRSPAMQLASV